MCVGNHTVVLLTLVIDHLTRITLYLFLAHCNNANCQSIPIQYISQVGPSPGSLHYDEFDNILFQLRGRKTVCLVPNRNATTRWGLPGWWANLPNVSMIRCYHTFAFPYLVGGYIECNMLIDRSRTFLPHFSSGLTLSAFDLE